MPCSLDLLDLHMIDPLKNIRSSESPIPISDSVMKQIDKEYDDYRRGWFPSVLGDSLRLGVLWLIMSPTIEDKDLVKRITNVSERYVNEL